MFFEVFDASFPLVSFHGSISFCCLWRWNRR